MNLRLINTDIQLYYSFLWAKFLQIIIAPHQSGQNNMNQKRWNELQSNSRWLKSVEYKNTDHLGIKNKLCLMCWLNYCRNTIYEPFLPLYIGYRGYITWSELSPNWFQHFSVYYLNRCINLYKGKYYPSNRHMNFFVDYAVMAVWYQPFQVTIMSVSLFTGWNNLIDLNKP